MGKKCIDERIQLLRAGMQFELGSEKDTDETISAELLAVFSSFDFGRLSFSSALLVQDVVVAGPVEEVHRRLAVLGKVVRRRIGAGPAAVQVHDADSDAQRRAQSDGVHVIRFPVHGLHFLMYFNLGWGGEGLFKSCTDFKNSLVC